LNIKLLGTSQTISGRSAGHGIMILTQTLPGGGTLHPAACSIDSEFWETKFMQHPISSVATRKNRSRCLHNWYVL